MSRRLRAPCRENVPDVTTTLNGAPRRIKWTCRFCLRHFETWTRRGLRVTCPFPDCGHVQEGPAGVQRLVEAQGKLRATKATSTPATVIKVVSVSNGHKSPAVKPPTAVKPTAPAAAAKAQPKPPAPAAPTPPAAPKKDPLSRILGF
jgi:hypothetical protein